MEVTSARNPRLRAAAALLRGRERRARGLHLAEGPGPVAEAVAHADVVEVFATAARRPEVPDGLPVLVVTDALLARLSDAVTPSGPVAVVRTPDPNGSVPDTGTVVVLDGVADPGNVGTLVRTAAALGAAAVVVTGPAADPYGPKAVRSSAGACYRIPIRRREDLAGAAAELRAAGREVVGLAAGRGRPIATLAGREGVALVLGSEAHGVLDPGVPDAWVHVPMPGGIESLNVAAAGAIALHSLLGATAPE